MKKKARHLLKYLLGVLFVLAGINHFIFSHAYASIVPAYLPWHNLLVYFSGIAEILLGAMLCLQATERFAAWGLIALIVAVTPANIQMAIHPELYPSFSPIFLWARLPLQLVLVAWASWFTRPLRCDE